MNPLGISPNAAAKRTLRSVALATFLALGCFSADFAFGHDPGLSVATARLAPGRLSIHLAMARCDVERLVILDADRDGKVTRAEFELALPVLKRKAWEAYEVTCGDRKLKPASVNILRDERDGVHFDFVFPLDTTEQLQVRASLLELLPRGHRQFLSLRDQANKQLGVQMLDMTHDSLLVQLSEQPAITANPHSFVEFLHLGVEHIATGFDHLLFLMGLLLVGGTLRSALKIITSFTFAHSITLALATLNLINVPSRIIEPLIALSIAYVGMDNILRRGTENRWMLTFGFGLIHGCGFATALKDLGIGSNGTSVAMPLVSFNLGVESGQLTIAAVALPLIWKFRASPTFVQRWVPIGSGLIVIAGGYWLIQRTLF